ncbi:MAG: hypothetical protein UU82_C0010G0005 [Candidatus Nomurabacteria bacterium GW2011_GWC2_41_8]|uniref:DUF3750 domain-containing protein n=3 Tax=Candidatus Nomuraibacteriota TaxID=1752729 RepID=A0A1F6YCV6_9BACT|nr:MAG: hypothetical protein UU58_C0004G0032 [Candidatus Nomurabacteria bacterium GW2011_GWA2_41_25]KKS24157.1 MAG: hypothetical protein UU82_C0010G0005 [Candidatus Nomurabacteria bacterium GW2011_GWC2_41_8]OGI67438.1 MAG: hypothetical protein A2823_00910 [Candidatus Nomurabacteria bacterium RIFCSPHIGHO2_01_FULL_41_91]OGI80552.1 MAG: hypothetical protein A3D43_02925 [Candidatus Nomurabacteria bacterium RIFCSPHIGHO2_02_FULL_41_52]OGI84668.1 MAG: hypothetical protein A3F49_02310 [Candidatus Nomur
MNSDTQKFQSLINKEKYQVFILACPTYTPFNFARHSWFVLNKKGLISRWEIRHKKNKKTNNYFYLNTQPPFQGINISFFIKKHFWKAKLMGYIEGSENSTAQKIIEFIENSEKIYLYCFKYSFFGPNSNTYIQWVLDKFPEFNVKLSWNFIGKGFKS